MSSEGIVGLEDKRFSSAKSDPRFKRVPRKVRKIEIDERFKGMFHEERFELNYSLDKRGRPVSRSSREDLQKFYRLEGTGEQEPTAAELVCRSRGEIEVDSSSSNESDQEGGSLDAGEMREELVHAWAEFDQSVGTTESSTARLAVCNMDWDRVTANDLFVLLSSLTPDHGYIRSVNVYPSEYGAKRLRIEEAVGPEELMGTGEGDTGATEDQSEAQETERVRKYQFNRLLYYYAIIETDSSTTSDYLYEQYNGTEYELTGTRLDIRVVPDEMDFSGTTPSSTATSETLPLDYHPATFYNSAMQHTNVQLTWDETDPDRQKLLNQDFFNTDIREMDFQAYLASASESEESSGGENESRSEEKTIAKFRSLLSELEPTDSSRKQNDVDLEITWEPGKLAPLEETISRRTGPDTALTPWQEYIQKRAEKRKIKRSRNKERVESVREEGTPYIESIFTELGGNKKKGSSRGKLPLEGDQREVGELELLMVSDSEGEGKEKQHFNMKEVWKNNKLSEKKKRKLAKKGLVLEDDFNLDLNDKRFVGLLESPQFAPDPSDSQFHQGRNLKGIIDERKRRREIQLSQGTVTKRANSINTGSTPVSTEQTELIALVRKLKNKQNTFKNRKNQFL